MSPSSNQLINVQFRKLEDIYISASQKNCTKCAHTVYNVTCLMKRKQLVAKSFTSLIYTNFNGRICEACCFVALFFGANSSKK